MDDPPKDWKLKLRYGKIKTEFQHFTVFADGISENLEDEFECPQGRAWMAMKTWARGANESMDMIRSISSQIGFRIDGNIEVYDTEAKDPPRETPHGYDINFTPYK